MSFLIKIAQFGIIALITYIGFIIYTFFSTVTSSDVQWVKLKYFSLDFIDLVGSFALAFMVHNAIT